MKTIYMVCRSKKETPHDLVRLMETLLKCISSMRVKAIAPLIRT
jgi:hypothetical protein